MASTPFDVAAATWIARLSESLQRQDAADATSLFLHDGWLRHFLVFEWDIRTIHGQDKIASYLSTHLGHTCLSDFALASDQYLKPSPGPIPETITSGFTFSTPIANGKGFFTLFFTGGDWKASTVFMTLDSLKGHEELGADQDLYNGRFPTWLEECERKWKSAEREPEVLIGTCSCLIPPFCCSFCPPSVGAGQNGLQVAARFRQMQISTLIIEQNARVGDTWRGRHPTLRLHTPKEHHSCASFS